MVSPGLSSSQPKLFKIPICISYAFRVPKAVLSIGALVLCNRCIDNLHILGEVELSKENTVYNVMDVQKP